MLSGRVMPVSTILADGTILWTGGSDWGLAGGDAGVYNNGPNPVFASEIYNPFTNTWTAVARTTVARLYHSGQTLLDDGRAVITGSEMQNYIDGTDQTKAKACFPTVNVACTDPFEYRMEVFEPPYMFINVETPVIQKAPSAVTYQSKFAVLTTTDATKISNVSLIRYASSTHSTNTDQRFVEAEIVSRNSSYILLQAPGNANLAPPGNYHLFLLRDGKPSVAKMIQIGSGAVTNDPGPANPYVPTNPNDPTKNDASHSFASAGLAVFVIMSMIFF